MKKQNPNWPQAPYHPNRISIIGGSGSGKTISLFNLISNQPDSDQIYLYAKDQYEAKYQLLIDKAKTYQHKSHKYNNRRFLVHHCNTQIKYSKSGIRVCRRPITRLLPY